MFNHNNDHLRNPNLVQNYPNQLNQPGSQPRIPQPGELPQITLPENSASGSAPAGLNENLRLSLEMLKHSSGKSKAKSSIKKRTPVIVKNTIDSLQELSKEDPDEAIKIAMKTLSKTKLTTSKNKSVLGANQIEQLLQIILVSAKRLNNKHV